MLIPILGLVAFAAVLVWLYRSKSADLEHCASALGLAAVSDKVERRGETAEGLAFYENLRARGTIAGCAAEAWERQVRRPADAQYRKSRGSILTVLELKPTRPPLRAIRLQPVGAMGLIEHVMKGTPPAVPTGDATFDGAYRLYADDGASALVALTANLRSDLLAFRQAVVGDLPGSVAGTLAAGTVMAPRQGSAAAGQAR